MSTNDDCTSLAPGEIRFYDNFVPALEVGDYLVNVTQRINPQNTTPAIDESFAASQFFSVQGPRYTLPPADVFSVFPPANAEGVFDQFLPNVVLAARELPWERNVFGDSDQTKQTPWLALLLFVAGEQIGGQDALLAPQVPDWSPNATMSANVTAAGLYQHPTGDGILWPALEKEWYESDDFLSQTVCSVIDISPEAFQTLVPSKDDLRYLAHVRQVDPTAKESDVLRINGDGWYSVVVGNRLPDAPPAGSGQPGQVNIAHLVSLEGLEQYVGGGALPQGTTRVRLISFQSWTFKCLPELGESFTQLMNGLLTDGKGKPKGTSFVLPVAPPLDAQDDAAQYAYRATQNGYVPLSYQTRLGEQTFAWYRGPCSPVPVANFIGGTQQGPNDPVGWQPFARASDAIAYDKARGIFDVSYGVAWETGRLLALSNSGFSQRLLDWERKAHALIDLICERAAQVPALKGFDPENPDLAVEKTLLEQLQTYSVTGDFMAYLVTQFSSQIAPKLADRPPSTTSPPFPAYPAAPPPVNPKPIQDVLAETDVQQLVREQGGQGLEAIADWLAQLYLLIGVPFENIVPNAALLPEESIRFFYLDSNWLGALVEGALSIGIESSRDRLYQDMMKDLVWDTTLAAVRQERDKLLGDWAQKVPAGGSVPFDRESLTGMLLRSAVVSGWPGLQVQAFAQTLPGSAEPDITSLMQPLRMERLSADVLLCLWPAVPAVVAVEEPHEGVAFGFEDPPEGQGEGYYLYPRSLDPGDYGTPLQGSQYQIDARGDGLIDANRLVKISAPGGILEKLKAVLPGGPDVQVRDFAVEMVKVPEQALFAAQSLAPKE